MAKSRKHSRHLSGGGWVGWQLMNRGMIINYLLLGISRKLHGVLGI